MGISPSSNGCRLEAARLVRLLEVPSRSCHETPIKLKIWKSWLGWIEVEKLGIKAYTKKATPKYVNDQETRLKIASSKIRQKISWEVVVVEDEAYVCADAKSIPEMILFHAQGPKDVG